MELLIKNDGRGVDVPCVCVRNYYSKGFTGLGRTVARNVKQGSLPFIRLAAKEMSGILERYFSKSTVDGPVYLVPVPGHKGKAEYTLALAEEISSICGIPVRDCLSGRTRETMYLMKRKKGKVDAPDVKFFAGKDLPEMKDGVAVLVDNVVATGRTAIAASKAALYAGAKSVVLACYADDYTRIHAQKEQCA